MVKALRYVYILNFKVSLLLSSWGKSLFSVRAYGVFLKRWHGWEVYLFFDESSSRVPTCYTFRQILKYFLGPKTTFCAAYLVTQAFLGPRKTAGFSNTPQAIDTNCKSSHASSLLKKTTVFCKSVTQLKPFCSCFKNRFSWLN